VIAAPFNEHITRVASLLPITVSCIWKCWFFDLVSVTDSLAGHGMNKNQEFMNLGPHCMELV